MKYIFLLISFLLAQTVHASTYKISSDKGHVIFLAKGKPNLVSIKGKGEGATGILNEKEGSLAGEIQFQLASLKTGIELRDEHLKNKYLEIDKFPTAILKIANLKLPSEMKTSFKFVGTLNLHGVDQPIEGMASISENSNMQTVSAEFKIKLSQFKIEIPNFKGITVAEEVQLNIEAPVVKTE